MSIWDTRFSNSKRPLAFDECLKAAGIEVQSKKSLTFDEALKIAGISLDEWITMKGTHIELGEGGEILHGAQGKFKNINDVPRKTVKQRKGESLTDLHLRAAREFSKQDDYATEKKIKDDLAKAKEQGDKLWLEQGIDSQGRDRIERYNRAAQLEDEGHRGAMAEFERRERLRREGKTESEIDAPKAARQREKDWNNPINVRNRERNALAEEQHAKGMALKQEFFDNEGKMSSVDRQKLEHSRETRDWNKDLPLLIDKKFIADELRSGNITFETARVAERQTQARLERPDRAGKETLNLTIYGDPNENPIEINVPKKYVASRSEVVAFRNANKN